MRRPLLLAAALCALLATPARADLAAHVDPMVGTLPPGFTVPGAVVPFGMVQNSPDTLGPLTYSGYMHNDALLRAFSLIHLSGPGVAKAGDLPFFPWVGPQAPPATPAEYASPYQHATEQAEAGYYRVRVERAATDVELTAGRRTALQRYRFPPAGDPYVIVNPAYNNRGKHEGGFEQTGTHEISGWARDRYRTFFVARFSEPIQAVGKHWVRFAPGSTVTMRAGVSFVDADGARRNLDAEAETHSFGEMRGRARALWNRQLAKVRVGGGTALEKRSLYTALYHSLLHPNVFEDVDGRYRGFDDAVHDVDDEGRPHHYANFSSWDTYKSQNQLLALIEPQRYADMLRSLLADARQAPGGNLPRWGEQHVDASHMSGDPAIPMIADGVCRGLLGPEETQALYEESAELVGRRPAALDALGYLPVDEHGSGAGTTLEYGVADFALALMADRLGRGEDAQRWLAQSLRYRNLLDPETKWIRPRNRDGSWHAPFDPATDETGFQEGNAWQYSWLVPHDLRGLFDRMGGDAAVRERFDTFFAAPPEVQTRLTMFGVVYRFPQWAPGNEHDIGAPFAEGYAGRPWRVQKILRDAALLYRPTIDGLPGNDDLGGLSAWYVWSALGLSPFTPGAPLLMAGPAQFERASIAVPGGRFTIEAPGAGPLSPYVQEAALNGSALDRAWFHAGDLRAGGTLRLAMGARPNEAWASGRDAAPPSASDGALARFGCTG